MFKYFIFIKEKEKRLDMEVNKRVQDLSQVFDRTWNTNRNNVERKEFLANRRDYFNQMHNIPDKNAQRQEILRANSVNGQVQSLNERMSHMNSGQRMARMNDFRNGFK